MKVMAAQAMPSSLLTHVCLNAVWLPRECEMTECPRLTMQLFNASSDLLPGIVGRHRLLQSPTAADASGLQLSRLFTVDEPESRCLLWHELSSDLAFEESARLQRIADQGSSGIDKVETMSFQLMRDVGDSMATSLPWLYIVHTDVPDYIVDEYNAWYDEEHLPRLVTVPGVVRARRYKAEAGSPRYLTAYDLNDRDAFSSPEGLKARKTPWTEKMRSLFSNTRRLTCKLISEVNPGAAYMPGRPACQPMEGCPSTCPAGRRALQEGEAVKEKR